MTAWLAALGTWNWFILGVLFLLIELLAPGVFMLWLGLAAIGVGIVSIVVDWTWQMQMLAFALFSAALIPAWRRFARKVEKPTDSPFLNRRTESYVGRVFALETPILNGIGTVRIDDTVWRVRGADAAVGTSVRVVRVDGPNLTVEPV